MGSLDLARRLRYLLKRHPFFYRFRYALITELDGVDFEAAPPDGRESQTNVPREFSDAVSRMDLAGDDGFDDAKQIAFDLSRGHRRGPGLGARSVKTLQQIYAGAVGGVCSDYTQVFLGLCRAAGVAAREWGLCAAFESHVLGHAFAEVYSRRHGKWIFLDPFYSVYAVRRDGSSPLAVTEIVDLVSAGAAGEVAIEIIDDEGKPGVKRDNYLQRYFNPGHAFFLLTHNDVFRQDPFLRWTGIVPLPILHMVMLLSGNYQRFHVYTNGRNRDAMKGRIGELKSWLVRCVILPATILALFAIAAIVLLLMNGTQ